MHHRRSAIFVWLVAAACATSTAYHAPPSPPPIDGGPAPVAGEMPPHRFFPREPTPREHFTPVAASFTALPAMVRDPKCVPAGAVPEGKPRVFTPGAVASANVNKRPAPAKKAGFAVYGTGDATEKSADRDAPAAAKASSPRADATPAEEAEAPSAPSAGFSDDGADSDRAPPTNVGIASDGDRQREGRRKERQAERKANKMRRIAGGGSTPSGPLAPATATPADESIAIAQAEPQPEPVAWPPAEEGWGEATFLSNDDTMSLSSAQRVAFAIDKVLPLPAEHVRPHELLNYFSFDTDPVAPGRDFSVRAEIAQSQRSPGMHTLALAVAGRPLGREGRRNAVLTFVIDRSGSMKKEGRMEFLKRGLLRMVRELKDGDVVHIVTFDHRVCAPLSNFVVGRDDPAVLTKTIHAIKPAGNTNLHAGLTQGYRLADASYQPRYTNRVVVITDALANTGVTDARTLAMVSDFFDARRIRLSGIGVGHDFNDALLDKLTEKGRGAYVFLGSPAEVDAVFGDRFVSLIETTANDVHFRLHLPPSLRIAAFFGEEASTVKSDVQAVHFFADSSQLLLADLEAWQSRLRPQDDIMIEIDYQHPETGEALIEEYAFNIGEIAQAKTGNALKGEIAMHFAEAIKRQALRGAPDGWQPRAASWRDVDALADCTQTRSDLNRMASGSRDREIARIVSLWDGYCARFEGQGGPRPARKDAAGWPSAR